MKVNKSLYPLIFFIGFLLFSPLVFSQDQHHEHHPPSSPSTEKAKIEEEVFDPIFFQHQTASGTSWQPHDSPHFGLHQSIDDWRLMEHWELYTGPNYQANLRGETQYSTMNWGMLMLSHPIFGGDLTSRTMLSLEPLTLPPYGYPLLLQTGETNNGLPLHDFQHPHDFFMELALAFRRPLWKNLSFEAYGGFVGEPAIGPVAFMHRMSAIFNPYAPLGHHWQDSTHITYGVLTAGIFTKSIKVEGSIFNGREPDESRWGFDLNTLDSYSGRIIVNPTNNLSMQGSYAFLRSPELLDPDENVDRFTGSIAYSKLYDDVRFWTNTAIYGVNIEEGQATNSVLLESTLMLDKANTIYGRFEFNQKTAEDLVLPGVNPHDIFRMESLNIGYEILFDPIYSIIPAIGVITHINFISDALKTFYGTNIPFGGMLYLQIQPPRLAAHH